VAGVSSKLLTQLAFVLFVWPFDLRRLGPVLKETTHGGEKSCFSSHIGTAKDALPKAKIKGDCNIRTQFPVSRRPCLQEVNGAIALLI
jgi:hypothetical protein